MLEFKKGRHNIQFVVAQELYQDGTLSLSYCVNRAKNCITSQRGEGRNRATYLELSFSTNHCALI